VTADNAEEVSAINEIRSKGTDLIKA